MTAIKSDIKERDNKQEDKSMKQRTFLAVSG